MRFCFFNILILVAQLGYSSSIDLLKKFDWDSIPVLHSITDEDRKADELILKELTVFEYFYENDQFFSEYILCHKITLVNTDLGIELNNKIYLGIENSTEMIVQKARVINRDGSVNILNENDIIEAVDQENKSKYKYFALEGLEKGCEIEYFYLIKTIPKYAGSSIYFQDEVARKNVEFRIYSPANLLFKTKSLNGFPDLVLTHTDDNKNLLSATIDYIPERKEEEYALYNPNLMQVMYKIDQDTLTKSANIVSYKDVATTLYRNIYESSSSKEHRLLKRFIKKIDIPKSASVEEKVRKIEQYIKTNIMVVAFNGSQDHENISSIIFSNVANDVGITKLFALIFNELKIDHKLVLTCDRELKKFDKDFESYHFLEQYLLYFSGPDKYLIPTHPFYRLGFIPYEFTNNYGLFICKANDGPEIKVESKIDFIPPADFTSNGNIHNVEALFGNDLDNPTIFFTTSLKGMYAQYFQPYYDFLHQNEIIKLNKDIIKSIFSEAEVMEVTSENIGSEHFGIEPLMINAKLTGEQFVELAGDKIIFKIGELLGPQEELYKANFREFDIESNFNREYVREIKFNIPQGYEVKNLDALNTDIYVLDKATNQRTMAFTSNYKRVDNNVIVTIIEYYTQIHTPVKYYNDFRKVINAAADFNKIALLIEPEKK